LRLPGQEPYGFCGGDGIVRLSVASLKFLNDLLRAYCWLGRHGYALFTIDDYLLLLRHWQAASPPPEPLSSLGIPADAGDDLATAELHAEYVKRAYAFIMLHEFGHLRFHDPPTAGLTPAETQAQESRADGFALEIMGRLGLLGSGIFQFFEWAWVFMPDPAEFPDEPSYWSAVQHRSHPLTTQRLVQVALDIETNAASYAKDRQPDTLATFQTLSRELRRLASLKGDPDMQRIAARRGAMLQVEDLAPRRPKELIAMPLGAAAGGGPFHGKLAGSAHFGANIQDIEVVLRDRSGQVTGAFANLAEIGHLDGTVRDGVLDFRWTVADMQGRGRLRFDGAAYQATLGLGDAVDQGATWTLRPAPPAS
jgi:hypothetical protein